MSAAFADILSRLIARDELDRAQMRTVMQALMNGACQETEAAALLVALRCKGETAAEIAAAAEVLREHMIVFDTRRDDVLDTCGTGGDGQATFNISTATALVTAATGVAVVKHGNRSVSSKSGSSDVLAELGVNLETDTTQLHRCLETAGLAFCYAPRFHPAMKNVAAVRNRIGIPTLFNCLGPLANPAQAAFQLLGVGRRDLLDLMAGALQHLGTGRALVVHSEDGLDEVSLSAPTHVRLIAGGQIESWTWTPADFGLESCQLAELRVANVQESAAILRHVLQGEDGPATRVVAANTAAALLAANRVSDVREGVEIARETLRDGKGQAVLEKLINATRNAD